MKQQLINSNTRHYSGITYNGGGFSAHFHNSFEIILVLNGQLSVSIGGHKTQIKTGELLLISPCAVHEINKNNSSKYFIAIITPDYVTDYFEAHKNDIATKFCMNEEAYSFISNNLINACSPSSFQLKSCFYLMLSFAEKGQVILSSKERDVSFIYSVNSYISEHFAEPLKRKDLALSLGYEEHYFSSLFQKNFKIGLREYLNIHRISFACKLLKTSKNSISRISFDSGFASVRSFNTVFFKFLGQTPTEYRNS